MPSWRYPSLLALIERGALDPAPLVTSRIALSQASAALAEFDGAAPPGISVITDFAQYDIRVNPNNENELFLPTAEHAGNLLFREKLVSSRFMGE